MPEWSSGFPYFLQFKSEFGNKEFLIWATISSRSCFCWLYRASPSSAAKNIINMISVLTIWWCPCVELSLVLLEEGVCYGPVHSLGKILLAFALLHSVLQGQICLLLQVSLDFLLLHSFLLGMILITTSCTMPQTPVHSSSGALSIRSNPVSLFVTSTVKS